ncbi:MAG: helix-turn-helix domain-containing protein [Oscillospiraceae bacterium]|nr:helix-turn-helix domain-containing protein [Oscillospiraceae bacterium]
MELGQLLKQARLEAGLSQRQLCGSEITRNMLSQIENGSAHPSMATLRYLADRLNKPMSYFLEEDAPSPNQALMAEARKAYGAGDYERSLEILAGYASPDSLCDVEKGLLLVLSNLSLAEQAIAQERFPYARSLLLSAAEAGASTPYYTPELERRRLLLLAQAAPEDPVSIAGRLPTDDRELLLRAEAALKTGNAARCAALLDAAEDHQAPHWNLLRGHAAFALGEYAQAAEYYLRDEPHALHRLEQCYRHLEDYKLAYYYACKQREK